MASEQINQPIATERELIAAGKKAAAEGEVMIAQRPLVRPHCECPSTSPVPEPKPDPDPPDYVLDSTDCDNVKAVVTMMKLTKIGARACVRPPYRDVTGR